MLVMASEREQVELAVVSSLPAATVMEAAWVVWEEKRKRDSANTRVASTLWEVREKVLILELRVICGGD